MRALLAWLLVGVALAAPRGWRVDGTGTPAGATPPLAWAEATPCWTARLPSWGNGSPVLAGGRLYVTSEPDRVSAIDARDGKVLWTRSLPVVDTFTGAARAELDARLASAAEDEARLKQLRAHYALLQKEVRRGEGDARALEALGGELASVQARLDGVAAYRVGPELGMIGATTPTPVVDGDRIHVLTGLGVLATLDRDGRVLWSRWLGPPVRPMRGWNVGHASSPLLVDGTLVVPYGHLRGLDPATGQERWRVDARWDHYGTPAVARPGGLAVVVTPGGEVVRARDGAVLATGLGGVFYVGPQVTGDVVLLVGNVDNAARTGTATATRLVRVGDGVKATRLWSVPVPDAEKMASTPVVWGGRVWSVGLTGSIWAFDLATGVVARPSRLTEPGGGFYASPVLVGDHLFVTDDQDEVVALELHADGTWRLLADGRLPASRATPWLEADRVYLRGPDALRCLFAR